MLAELCGEGRLLGGAGGAAAAVGLDTEWAPPGSECAVLLQLEHALACAGLRASVPLCRSAPDTTSSSAAPRLQGRVGGTLLWDRNC